MDTVYLLQCGPFLKIGYTSTPLAKRLSQIRNACPYAIEVLASRPGTLADETMLHDGAKQWLHDFGGRSWYEDCQELRRFCDTYFYADREITYETACETPAASEAPAVEVLPESGSVTTLPDSEPLFGDVATERTAGFRQGVEGSAKLVDKLARGVLSGEALPSCANPILVSGALGVLAEEIRKLQPESLGVPFVEPERL
jgi:hypothetical protein